MEKFIPYEKLSKKEKRKMDLAKRQTWGELNPVTRKPENSRAYNRKKTQDWKKELPNPAFRYFVKYSGWKPSTRRVAIMALNLAASKSSSMHSTS